MIWLDCIKIGERQSSNSGV